MSADNAVCVGPGTIPWMEMAMDMGMACLVRLCRVTNAICRRCFPRHGSLRLRVWLLTLQQPLLRWSAFRQLNALPRTGLHGDRVDPIQFGRFCTHAFAMFRQSPRTKLLRRLCLDLAYARQTQPDVAWLLCNVLQMPPPLNNGEDEVSWMPQYVRLLHHLTPMHL